MSKMFILFVLILGVCAGSPGSDTDTYNMLADEILFTAKQYILEWQMDTLSLPNIDMKLDKTKVGAWTLTGFVNASSGSVINTTSIRRVGDVTVQLPDDKLIFTINVAFDVMDATYEQFDFSFGIAVGSTGGMRVVVGQNQVALQVTLEKNDKVCLITVDKAEMTILGGIEIQLLPDGFWNKIKDKTYSLYLNHYSDDLRDIVNEHLQPILQMIIDKINPCSYIPF